MADKTEWDSAVVEPAPTEDRLPDEAREPGPHHGGAPQRPTSLVGADVPHDNAISHVTGTVQYTEDLAAGLAGVLHAWPVQAPIARGRIVALDAAAALAAPGVVKVLTIDDIPGTNQIAFAGDQPLIHPEVVHEGQAVAWVLAETRQQAIDGALAVRVEYERLPAVLTLDEAIAADEWLFEPMHLLTGDAAAALASAAHVVTGTTVFGGQEHLYFECQTALAQVDSEGQVVVHSSTQAPASTQGAVAAVLGVALHQVTVESLRMGGAFGGKETQADPVAAVAALGSVLTRRPVLVRLDRAADSTLTGKRHPGRAEWRIGFDADLRIVGLTADIVLDGGWCADLSQAVVARALCHIDNAYLIPAADVLGRAARTNKTSQTAFRGFGGPQGMFVIEDIMGRAALRLGVEPDELRRRNFYRPGERTPYQQEVNAADRLGLVWEQARTDADYDRLRREVDAFNAAHEHTKRGLAITPVKFGVSFNQTFLNQAGALVHVYRDGTVLVSHGGTEMGQGLHTKMLMVAAEELGIPLRSVRLAPTRTDKVPNSSATSASTGADLNGYAVQDACAQIIARLRTVAAELLETDAAGVTFADGVVSGGGRSLPWAEVVEGAYVRRVQLWSSGFYSTPGLSWNAAGGVRGTPFKYFVYDAGVTQVEVDGDTGAYRWLSADLACDAGDSLAPLLDVGQIEGAYVQGVGWLTQEELLWDTSDDPGRRGRLATRAFSTYKIPGLLDIPERLGVRLMTGFGGDGSIHGSKAVGEPPLMLAFSAFEALRDAVAAFGPPRHEVVLPAPATPEAVYWAIKDARAAAGRAG